MKDQETKKRIIVQTKKHRSSASRIEQHYTKIVGAFVTLSVILIACIVYFSFTKTTITVTATPKTITESFDIPLSEISGKIFLTEATGTATVDTFSSTTEKPAKATGKITIYNTYSQNQPLRATTRLLSTNGVLFRTVETVTVPARGSLTVDVVADQEGATGNIAPSRFEIVALSNELKSKIYGESTTAMTGGVVTSTTISQNDVDALSEQARADMLTMAEDQFTEELKERTDLPNNIEYSSIIVHGDLSNESSATVGSTAESLTVTVAGTAAIAAFDKELLLTQLSKEVSAGISNGFTLKNSLNPDDVTGALVLNAEDGSDAVLRVSLQYQTIISTSHEKLAKKYLTNMSENRIKAYILSVTDASDITIQFSPFWLKMTPSLEDHITITIQ